MVPRSGFLKSLKLVDLTPFFKTGQVIKSTTGQLSLLLNVSNIYERLYKTTFLAFILKAHNFEISKRFP